MTENQFRIAVILFLFVIANFLFEIMRMAHKQLSEFRKLVERLIERGMI